MTTLVCRWRCLQCDDHGEGTWRDVVKAADKHTRTVGHGTIAGAEAKR